MLFGTACLAIAVRIGVSAAALDFPWVPYATVTLYRGAVGRAGPDPAAWGVAAGAAQPARPADRPCTGRAVHSFARAGPTGAATSRRGGAPPLGGSNRARGAASNARPDQRAAALQLNTPVQRLSAITSASPKGEPAHLYVRIRVREARVATIDPAETAWLVAKSDRLAH